MPDQRPAALTQLIDSIAHLLSTMTCQHCGRPPYDGARSGPDGVGERERRLWRLVDQAERVRDEAPAPPPADQLATARAAVQASRKLERSLRSRIDSAEEALASPLSWLRPTYRFATSGHLSDARQTLEAVAVKLAHEDARLRALEVRHARHHAYLAGHRAVLEAAERARADLGARVDACVQAYTEQSPPPTWFTLGLGYPPDRTDYEAWLRRVRAAVAYRRRHGVTHPLEPLGTRPDESNARRYRHWREARRAISFPV